MNLIFDFDSTIIKIETIDLISSISLNLHPQKNDNVKNNQKITNQAMEGKMSFDKALNMRVKMIRANKDHIKKAQEIIKKNITNSFIKNKKFLINNSEKCYIVSGGFTEIIIPIAKMFNIKESHVFGNDFIYNHSGDITGINKTNILSQDKGKVNIVNKIKGNSIIIGDGYTDYEIKKYNPKNQFIQFVENINRKNLNQYADLIANNFLEIVEYLKNNEF